MALNAQSIGGNAGMTVIVSVAGYLLGCIATGYYLVRWRTGLDVRKMGSGNIGARNVGRVMGRGGFLLTLIGDFAKGTAAVCLAFYLTHDPHQALFALIAVSAGHMWPVQLGFRGGKGISTSIGGMLLFPPLLGCFFLFCAVVFVLLRKMTLAGMVAYALLPAACYFLKWDGVMISSVSALAIMILLAHRNNIVEDILLLFRPSLSTKTVSSIKKS